VVVVVAGVRAVVADLKLGHGGGGAGVVAVVGWSCSGRGAQLAAVVVALAEFGVLEVAGVRRWSRWSRRTWRSPSSSCSRWPASPARRGGGAGRRSRARAELRAPW